MKTFIFYTFLILSLFGGIFFTNDSYTKWEIKNNATNKDSISWANFKWVDKEINGKFFEKTSMFIPCKIDGVPTIVTFQFDLGADLTCVYEKNYSSFYTLNPKLANNIKKTSFRHNTYYENISIHFGDYTATTKIAFVVANYGNRVESFTMADTIHMGSICADMFKDKVLIIDYPNKRFAISDKIPNQFSSVELTDISLDKKNRALLPMKIHNKEYKVLFDNGSSMFPLIANATNISEFSNSANVDSIEVTSWGTIHNVTGKLIKEPFTLGGQNFNSSLIYTDNRKGQDKNEWDLIAGNALFWNKTVILDYKNKKIGVK